MRHIIRERPDLRDLGERVMAVAAQEGELLRSTPQTGFPVPVDLDSRLELLRCEDTPELEIQPTWPPEVASELKAVLEERKLEQELIRAGIHPTKSLLLIGPPGVGKTLAARWIALHLHRQLLTLDLAAVMSSYLGRTGNNIRVVLDYARRFPSVMLLDEFDAIAKRRDDTTEIGELKRLVTVLLQAVDEWPSDGLLIAATNHPDLLDPAIWRRFDRVIRFPLPGLGEIKEVLQSALAADSEQRTCQDDQISTLAALFHGRSFADITREVSAARRYAIVNQISIPEALNHTMTSLCSQATTEQRLEVARLLQTMGKSQRSISLITQLSRDTIRKRLAGRDNHRNEGR